MNRTPLSILAAALALVVSSASSQMEKRDGYLYDPVAFARQKPVVGERAPELSLSDLDGRPVCLDDFLGRTMLVVKGGFT